MVVSIAKLLQTKDFKANGMSVETPSGVSEYPVTKFCMAAAFIVPLAASLAETKYLFDSSYQPFIEEYKQYYRYITSSIGSYNESDAILMLLLWYQMRHLERLLGSVKYACVILNTWGYSTMIITFLHLLINRIIFSGIWNQISRGGLPVILGLWYFYKQYTPQVYQFNVSIGPQRCTANSTRIRPVQFTLNDQFLLDTMIILAVVNQGLFSGAVICALIGQFVGLLLDRGFLHTWRPIRWSPKVSNSQDSNSDQMYADDEPVRPLGTQFLDTFRR